MAIADNKKCQAFINRVGREVAAMRAGMVRINAIKAKFVASNPSVAGTPLQGNVAAANTAITNLDTALGAAAFTGMINAVISTCDDALDL